MVNGTRVLAPSHQGRPIVLLTLALAQLMIVLDGTIVTIALPAIASDLRFSQASLQWVVNAYTLAFGGLLLLGGRIADLVGRRRAMLGSLIGFSMVSALGGLADDQTLLVLARGGQGIFAAVLAPAALSTLSVSFHEPIRRARAFAVFGAIGTVGAIVGLLLGGIFTSYLTWRWTLWVNVPIGLATAALVILSVPPDGNRNSSVKARHVDFAGAALVTTGVVALVLGFVESTASGWASPKTLSLLAAAIVLTGLFVVRQVHARNPLVPPSLVRDRSRSGAFLSSLFNGAGVLGMFYFISQYLQVVQGYSAIQTGIAFLPNTVAVLLGTTAAQHFLPRRGHRPVAILGCALSAIGVGALALLTPSSSFAGHLLPAGLILSFGLGLSMVTLASAALHDVAHADAGVASGVFTAAQQIGGASGLAIFATVAASVTGDSATTSAINRGFTAGFAVAAVFFVIAGLLAATLTSGAAGGDQSSAIASEPQHDGSAEAASGGQVAATEPAAESPRAGGSRRRPGRAESKS